MTAGQIVILNGAPRAGKSSLARAVQAQVPGQWVHWGVDALNAALPPALLPGIGLRPGGERPDLEPVVARLYAALFAGLASLARQGFDGIADLGLHRDYAGALDPVALMRAALGDLPLLLVGVDCALPRIMERRRADPQGGFYLAGPGVPAPVRRWQRAVHENQDYHLRLDMGVLSPEAGARQIARALGRERDWERSI